MTTRFGLFGTGFWAEEVHAQALADNPDIEFVGVWGRNPESTRRIAARFGVTAFDDPDQLIEASAAVAIALSPEAQAPLAIRAAQAGRHLLLEKPLAFTTENAIAIAEAVESSGVASLVFLTHRFVPEVATWLERVRSERWDSARAQWFSPSALSGSPFAGSEWRQAKGGLWDIGPHAVSLAIRALGPIGRIEEASLDEHSSVHLTLAHESGARTSMSLGIGLPQESAARTFSLTRGEEHSAMPDPGNNWVGSHQEATRQLLDMIAAGQSEHPCNARFNAEVVRVLEDVQGMLAAPAH